MCAACCRSIATFTNIWPTGVNHWTDHRTWRIKFASKDLPFCFGDWTYIYILPPGKWKDVDQTQLVSSILSRRYWSWVKNWSQLIRNIYSTVSILHLISLFHERESYVAGCWTFRWIFCMYILGDLWQVCRHERRYRLRWGHQRLIGIHSEKQHYSETKLVVKNWQPLYIYIYICQHLQRGDD